MDIIKVLAEEFEIKEKFVGNIVTLIDEGNTIPFIARYRKELTNSCDDQVLRKLNDRLTYLRNLEKRKEEIISSIEGQGKLTEELSKAIAETQTLSTLEDLYRPFKQKKKTRASVAKERGLEPLSDIIFAQGTDISNILKEAERFITDEVPTAEDAINGAKDIIAENISDSADGRKYLKRILNKSGLIQSKADTEEDSVYKMYYDYNEPLKTVPGHRILAMNRGEKEEILKVSVIPDEDACIYSLTRLFVKKNSACPSLMNEIILDSFKRLIFPSLEREIRSELTQKASEKAIDVFGKNLKSYLMQPPIKGKVTMGFDPAYRTGCKIAVVDPLSNVLDTCVVYPTPPQNKTEEAKKTLTALIKKHGVEIISIGNGTASKESEIFVAELIKELDVPVSYVMTNEAGASVYSASELGATEFPEFDVSLRSAVSIARRLQDPLSELVKIEPQAIGVGQYQHDMPKKQLDSSLGGVVEECVNSVGVDLNTASPSLLSYVAGITSATAQNIMTYRAENGAFTSRAQLKKVPKLGPKAFEQCAGFLRIPESNNILDNTAVHPESYKAAQKLLEIFGYSEKDVKENKLSGLKEKVISKGIKEVAELCGVGELTLSDIAEELEKPGRDIRDSLEKPILRTDVMSIKDLAKGMKMTGTVRNVIDFGAFVDIGVHQDGLVHISQITDRYIKHPLEVLKVGDIVNVTVIDVDEAKNRISLSMKE